MTTPMASTDTMSSAMRSASNYHDWVFGTFAPFLHAGRTLEIGSGHGQYSKRMASRVRELIVSDIDADAINSISLELRDLPNVSYVVMDGLEPARLSGRVDNIVLVNVLEHIDQDHALLSSCNESLGDDGSLIIFVPAFPLLFSRMDRDAGHFRRYSRRRLQELLVATGFTIRHLRYVNAVGFFGWLANKWMGSAVNSPSTNLQVAAYDRLVPFVRYFDRVFPFVGQSLLAIASKRG